MRKNRTNRPSSPRMGLVVGAVALAVAGGAWAEGSRTMHPRGYFLSEGGLAAANEYARLYSSGSSYLNGLIRQQTFLYVYAKPGERISISRGGSSGTGNDVTLYAPPSAQMLAASAGFDPATDVVDLGFGTPGQESVTGLTKLVDVTTNSISDRGAELEGLGGYLADITYDVPSDGSVPPEGAVFAVVFTGTVPRWDVTVQDPNADPSCVDGANGCVVADADLNGRVFTYAFAGTSTSETSRIFSSLYYVTSDGYRYAQVMRGLAPYNYVLYSNDKGFIDKELITGSNPPEYREQPLYKSVRGSGHTLSTLRHNGSGSGANVPANTIGAQGPKYPIFFSDVMAAETLFIDPEGRSTQNRIADTLEALGIPLVPPEPIILSASTADYPDATAPSFTYPPTDGSTSYYGQGGTFRFWAQDVTSYRIFIKGATDPSDQENLDHPENRVLEGTAVPGLNEVSWDGLRKDGMPMPVGDGYNFIVTGRNGEVHFPFLDAEANLSGGPTVKRLNGQGTELEKRTVYYDDRGYVSPFSKLVVGDPDGNICGNNSQQPSSTHALEGVDSEAESGGTYYRSWGVGMSGNSGSDCDAASTKYFGDAKGLDLWAYISSNPLSNDLEFDIVAVVDVTAEVSAPGSVPPGAQVVSQVRFRNLGSTTAENTTYLIRLPKGTAGVSCVGATCAYDAAGSTATQDVYRVTGLPESLSGFGVTEVINLFYTAPGTPGTVTVEAVVETTSSEPDPHAPNSASAATLVDNAATPFADVTASVAPPSVAQPGSTVQVPVIFTNIGTTGATGVTYQLELQPGLTGVTCAAPANCNYSPVNGVVTVTGLPAELAPGASVALELSYTAPSDPGKVPVRAVVDADNDSNGGNNQDSGETSIWAGIVTADVTVTISPPATANRGATVQVPVVFRNNGPAEADTSASGSFSVTVPAGLSGVACAPAVCSVTGTSITWNGPDLLGNGQKFEVSFSYIAPDSGFALGVKVDAEVGTSTSESNMANNTATATTALVEPDMTVVVTVPSGPFLPNEPVTGAVVCTNSGSAPATDATCTVDEPEGVTNWSVSCSPTVPIATLPVGEVITCDYSFDMPEGSDPVEIVGKTGSSDPYEDESNNEDTGTIQPGGQADVFSLIQLPGSASPGDRVTALLTFGNQGSVLAEGVAYEVTGLPLGLGAVSCEGATCAYDGATGKVVITGLPTVLAAGQRNEVELKWTVPASADDSTLTLTSVIRTTTVGNPENNDTDSAEMVVPAGSEQQGEVSTSVSVPANAGAGEEVIGTVRYTNIGSVTSTGMTYRVEVNGADGTPVVRHDGQQCTVDTDGALSGCGLPESLPTGESVQLEVAYTTSATVGDTVTVITTVGASNDTDANNNTAQATTRVRANPVHPDVTASVAPPATAVAGQTVIAPVTFTNIGASLATSVTYQVTLPAGLSGVECTPGCSYNPTTGVLIVPVGLPAELVPGQSTGFEVRYVAPESGVVQITSRVDAGNEQVADQGNNPAVATTHILAPGVLDLLKSVYLGHDGGARCASNEAKLLTIVEKNPHPQNVTWCFRVTNTGTAPLGAPEWNDPELPGYIPTLVNGSLPLAAGQTAVWFIEAVHERSVVNTVSLSMPVTDGSGNLVPGAPPATGSDTVETVFGLIFDPPFGLKVGTQQGQDVIRWTMVWVNDNVVRAENVEIVDQIQVPMTWQQGQSGPICQGYGETTYSICEYEPATNRVRVVADFGPDFGVTPANSGTAQNRLEISFNVTVAAANGARTLENQGVASWVPPGGNPGDPLTGETFYQDEQGNPVNGPTPVVLGPPGGDVTAIPVDNPVALLLLALGMAGLMARRLRVVGN